MKVVMNIMPLETSPRSYEQDHQGCCATLKSGGNTDAISWWGDGKRCPFSEEIPPFLHMFPITRNSFTSVGETESPESDTEQ
jgi:hypothetical protein